MTVKKQDEMKEKIENIQKMHDLRVKQTELLADIDTEQAELDILQEQDPEATAITPKQQHIKQLKQQAKEIDKALNSGRIAEYQAIKKDVQSHQTSPFFTTEYRPYKKLYKKIAANPTVIRALSQRNSILSTYEKKIEQFISALEQQSLDSHAIRDMESALYEQSNLLQDTDFSVLEAIIKAQGKAVPACPPQLSKIKTDREQIERKIERLQYIDDDNEANIEAVMRDAFATLSVDSTLLFYELKHKYRKQLESVAFASERKRQLAIAAIIIFVLLALALFLNYAE